MTIVTAFIALLSFFVACLALTFTIGSFWWLNARRGRLMTLEPHSFAAVAKGQSKLRFPLVLYNTGAIPIVVQDMRLWFPGTPSTVLPWSTTRSQLMPAPDDRTDLPAAFSIPGRTAQQKFIEFGRPFGGNVPASDCRAQIDVKLGHRSGWEQLITFTFWATRIEQPHVYIAYHNSPSNSSDSGPQDGT
jgi:hypothetical protein